MDVELIDKSHLKISLQKSDLQHYNITFESLSYESDRTRGLIKEILIKASNLTGFSYMRCRLLIEVYPDFDSGCIILFTKLRKLNSIKRLKLKAGSRSMIFCFDNADDLMFCIERLYNDRKLYENSSLYLLSGKYYLAVTAKIGTGRRAYLTLSEFASINCSQNENYYTERGKLLCKDDVFNKIGALVSG